MHVAKAPTPHLMDGRERFPCKGLIKKAQDGFLIKELSVWELGILCMRVWCWGWVITEVFIMILSLKNILAAEHLHVSILMVLGCAHRLTGLQHGRVVLKKGPIKPLFPLDSLWLSSHWPAIHAAIKRGETLFCRGGAATLLFYKTQPCWLRNSVSDWKSRATVMHLQELCHRVQPPVNLSPTFSLTDSRCLCWRWRGGRGADGNISAITGNVW